jgi:hypothetical protein
MSSRNSRAKYEMAGVGRLARAVGALGLASVAAIGCSEDFFTDAYPDGDYPVAASQDHDDYTIVDGFNSDERAADRATVYVQKTESGGSEDRTDEEDERALIYVASNAQDDNDNRQDDNQALSSGSSESNTTSLIQGDFRKDSTHLSCPEGSNDLGEQTKWYRGKAIPARFCEILSIPSNSRADKEGRSPFAVPGSTGYAIADASIAPAMVALGEAAKADGITLVVNSSFRNYDHEMDVTCRGMGKTPPCDLSNINTALYTNPGYSIHNTVAAYDWAGMRTTGGRDCSARAREPNNKAFNWLVENGPKFGLYQYSYESWHWDFLDAANRCDSPSDPYSNFDHSVQQNGVPLPNAILLMGLYFVRAMKNAGLSRKDIPKESELFFNEQGDYFVLTSHRKGEAELTHIGGGFASDGSKTV